MSKVSLSCCFLLGLLVLVHAKENKKIEFYELKTGDLRVNLTNYGASIVSLFTPDKHGKLADIVLGYDSIESYETDTCFFGALIGRVANRIGGAKFTLDGKTYTLPANDHGNTLHGGTKGFGDNVWTVDYHKKDSHITFVYNSFDGEQGFPGKVEVRVTYMLLEKRILGVKMTAKPIDKPTPINLAQHAYWNLRGHDSGDILSHTVQIFGSNITPVDDKLIPTGKLQPVANTPYDFLTPKEVGSRINDLPGLYDINYALDKSGQNHLSKNVVVRDPVSGRKMELWSNQVGLQYYTSGMLGETKGKNGATYHKYGGIVLETQGYPDSVNLPNFPSQIVKPGETYKHLMVYRFTAS
ncbi:unnamed protein product [Lathyrus sativus]|nr:unnamed protein product [Lathyrus sativus]